MRKIEIYSEGDTQRKLDNVLAIRARQANGVEPSPNEASELEVHDAWDRARLASLDRQSTLSGQWLTPEQIKDIDDRSARERDAKARAAVRANGRWWERLAFATRIPFLSRMALKAVVARGDRVDVAGSHVLPNECMDFVDVDSADFESLLKETVWICLSGPAFYRAAGEWLGKRNSGGPADDDAFFAAIKRATERLISDPQLLDVLRSGSGHFFETGMISVPETFPSVKEHVIRFLSGKDAAIEVLRDESIHCIDDVRMRICEHVMGRRIEPPLPEQVRCFQFDYDMFERAFAPYAERAMQPETGA
jgi:hypothetical protein